MTMLEAAIKYHDMGLSIIPLAPNSKVPPKGFSQIPYRERLATVDEINGWWKENPNYNIGIVTGKINDLFVIDLDKYHPEYSEEIANQYIPDSITCPTSNTPRGGQHLYFSYPDVPLTIGAKFLPGIDYRGEGGHIVAPPSVTNGKAYEWVIEFERAALTLPPKAAINKISTLYRGVTSGEGNVLHPVTFSLDKGSRDETLFHIAHCLIKGGASKEDAINTLEILAKSCKPPFPPNEIVTKCNSVIERAARKERNLTAEITDLIAVTSGWFPVTSCYNVLQVVTKQDKTSIRVALNRLKEKGIVERHPTQDGLYRRVETNFDFITFDEDEAPEVEYPVKLPLDLNSVAEISQGNIILVAGEFNAGKTSFMLNILKDNKARLPIRYITSEMSKSEFKKRFASFGLPLSFWLQDENTEYIRKSCDFHTVIKSDALNIIDYMEFRDSDYTKGAEYLTQMHDALKTGIAIVAVQKKEGLRMPRSGDMILEKPRLAISLSKHNSMTNDECPQGVCEVLKCKMPKVGKADGKKLRFELQKNGSRFHVLNDWGWWKF